MDAYGYIVFVAHDRLQAMQQQTMRQQTTRGTNKKIMIALSSIFSEANNQSEKQRDVLVMVEDETLFAEKLTQADWTANSSETDIDYTPPHPPSGDVILAGSTTVDVNFETGGDTWGNITAAEKYWAQGFEVASTTIAKRVQIYARSQGVDVTVRVHIYSSAGGIPGASLGVSENIIVTSTLGWFEAELSVDIIASTLYYIVVEHVTGAATVEWRVDSNNGYADGKAMWWETSAWVDGGGDFDAYFRLYTGYKDSGSITTNNFDLGEIPTQPGEWVLEDVTPDDSALTYTAEYSTTGAWGGEEVSIGAIIDGQAITDLKRYWRVASTLISNTARDETPILQSIKADYTTYKRFNKTKDLGYEPLVDTVSSLTSKVDFFKPASIGKIGVSLVVTDSLSDWVYNDTLYNKIVRVKLGFNYPGFTQADYIDYFSGAIDDWNIIDGILNLTLKDLSKEWKLPVPSKWEDAGDNRSWVNIHHTDIMLDVFQNDINVRDSGLLLDSFATVKAATPAYKATRTITGKTEDAKKLVEELRVLLFAFFLPRGDGKIGIKQFDSTEPIRVTFTDDNTLNIKWRANSKDLVNRTSLYFDWDGVGDKEEDFAEYDGGDTGASQTKFQEVRPYILKDKWTDVSEASQISDLKTKILAQFDDMPSSITITCDAKDIAYEAGDMMGVTTLEAPGPMGAGITDEKYLIVSKNLDFLGDKIIFEGLKVAV